MRPASRPARPPAVRRWSPARRAARGLAVGAALITGLAGGTRPARAYVQYHVLDQNTGLPTNVLSHWTQSCIPLTAYPNDLADMTADQVTLAATSAAASWSKGSLPCTFMDIEVSTSTGPTRAAANDVYNVLVFRNPWCDPADPTGCVRDALAITSVWSSIRTGVITNGDIEVNSENFVWADLVINPANGKQDLQNALTHEMGHLIGLDHNCYTPGVDPARQIDNLGNPVPDCAGAPQAVVDATMYTKADPGDLSKRTLAPDDQQAVCDIYPAAQAINYCPVPGAGQGGCSCHAGGNGGGASDLGAAALAFVFVGLGVALARARTRTRRSRRC
jgi:hypothetical protein